MITTAHYANPSPDAAPKEPRKQAGLQDRSRVFEGRAVSPRDPRAFAFDFAASKINAVCPRYFSRAQNALRDDQDWRAQLAEGEWGWLNPEFNNIEPYAERCYRLKQAGGQIAFLTPLSSSNWMAKFVHNKARVLMINGRLSFMANGEPYPKDCMLSIFSNDPKWTPRYDVWRWRRTLDAAEEAERNHGKL